MSDFFFQVVDPGWLWFDYNVSQLLETCFYVMGEISPTRLGSSMPVMCTSIIWFWQGEDEIERTRK
jgi:hypothetical protein